MGRLISFGQQEKHALRAGPTRTIAVVPSNRMEDNACAGKGISTQDKALDRFLARSSEPLLRSPATNLRPPSKNKDSEIERGEERANRFKKRREIERSTTTMGGPAINDKVSFGCAQSRSGSVSFVVSTMIVALRSRCLDGWCSHPFLFGSS